MQHLDITPHYDVIAHGVFIACMAAFTILSMDVTGLRSDAVKYAPGAVSRAYACDFCLSFWAVLLYVGLFGWFGTFPLTHVILITVTAPALTYKLIQGHEEKR